MHLNSEFLFKKYLQPYFKSGMTILEIGPDSRNPDIFKIIVNDPSIIWETVDIEKTYPELMYVCSGEYTFPMENNRYDIVFSSSVIEHVRKVWVWIKELARVCKPGGQVLTISPISWPYHGVPFDCWRIYPEGMKALYGEAGLQVESSFFQTLEEGADLGKDYPGKSASRPAGKLGGLKQWVKKWVRWPNSYAVDLVTLGFKSGSSCDD